MTTSNNHAEPYKNLADNVILQAVEDYRKALTSADTKILSDCERFFKSDWFRMLSPIDGENVMTKIKEEYIYE